MNNQYARPPGMCPSSACAVRPPRGASISHRRVVAGVAAAQLLVAGATALASNVPEGGFEQPALGVGSYDYNPNDPVSGQSAWTFGGASGIAYLPGTFAANLAAPEGSQVAFLQTFGSGTPASICQTVGGFQAGVEYFVSAALAHRTDCLSCNGPVDIQIVVDGNIAGTVPGANIPTAGFAPFRATFVAAGTDVQLCINEPPAPGQGDATNFVDLVYTGIFHIFIDGFDGV